MTAQEHLIAKLKDRLARTALPETRDWWEKYLRDAVVQFIEQHLSGFTLESLRNALKYFDKDDQQVYVQRLKASD